MSEGWRQRDYQHIDTTMDENNKSNSTLTSFDTHSSARQNDKLESFVSFKKFLISTITAAILAMVLGVLIGNATVTNKTGSELKSANEKLEFYDNLVTNSDEERTRKIADEVSASHIRSFLRNVTSKPRMAGTQSNRFEAQKMKQLWIDHGLPQVELHSYDVLLSYPDADNPNSVSILSSSDEVLFQTSIPDFTNADLDLGKKISPPFNAFSASGTVTGELVYAHYGREDDLKYLTDDLKLDLSGKLLLIRYDGSSRGKKAVFAQTFNVSGVIFYSDPEDFWRYGNSGYYPRNLNIPPDGVQRGSLSRVRSDILTPGYPATASAYRRSIKEAEDAISFPKIPTFPISFSDATQLLKVIDGEPAPEEWKGDLNVSYNIGPQMKDDRKVRLTVGNINSRRVINNIIGIIPGEIEPDRYVLAGNHRDSWTYGASDPGSATACLIEMTRVFGKMYKNGWRPRRTIMFISWDAEEYGYVGSAEWLEEHRFILNRAVTYLNIDQAVTGNMSFGARATPSVRDVLYEITKKVKNPDKAEYNRGRKTVYATWSVRRPDGDNVNPKISQPNGGSDFYPFIHYLGVPVSDFRYHDTRLSNPLYHTKYEAFDMQNNLIDPEFEFHRAVTQIWVMMVTSFSQPVVLPLKISAYIPILKSAYQNFKNVFQEKIKDYGLKLEYLDEAFEEYYKSIKNFEEVKSEHLSSQDPFLIRRINDQMMEVERAFIGIENGTDRKNSQNVLLGMHYLSKTKLWFGPLSKVLATVKDSKDPQVEEVKKKIAILTYHLNSAALVLQAIPHS